MLMLVTFLLGNETGILRLAKEAKTLNYEIPFVLQFGILITVKT